MAHHVPYMRPRITQNGHWLAANGKEDIDWRIFVRFPSTDELFMRGDVETPADERGGADAVDVALVKVSGPAAGPLPALARQA